MKSEFISIVKEKTLENIDFILSELGFDIDEFSINNDEMRSSCPIHEGDNSTAFSINCKYGSWRCYTNKCHENHGNSIFHLISAILSKDQKCSFYDAITWVANKLNIEMSEDYELSSEEIELNKSIRYIKNNIYLKNKIDKVVENDFIPFKLSIMKDSIKTSKYFLDQGFSKETLDHFHVGFCNEKNKPMYLRSFAPILSEDGEMVLGVTGRTIHEKCEYCPEYHIKGNGCPRDNPIVRGYPKWKHFGFKKSNVLYNIHDAKDHIKKYNSVIITEGPKEVWWLYQYNIKNVICLFGLDISFYQIKKLIEYGVNTIIVMLDNDEKGIEATEKLISQCNLYFNIININEFLKINKDIDELSDFEMKEIFLPQINRMLKCQN
jgi:DNA primase